VKIQTTEITALQFRDDGFDPAPPEADADTAIVVATARVDSGDGWEDGCIIVAGFQDRGEPQEDVTAIIDLTCPSGVYYDPLFLNGGNIQIHDGTKD